MLITLKQLRRILTEIDHTPSLCEIPEDAPIMLQFEGSEREIPLNIAIDSDGNAKWYFDGAYHITLGKLDDGKGHCPSCHAEGVDGEGCPTCPGFWYTKSVTPI